LDIVKTLLETSFDGIDLRDGLVEERVDLMLHIHVLLIVVLLQLDSFHSLVHLSDQVAEFVLGGLLLLLI